MYTVKNIRKHFGLGQKDLATLLGVSRFSILRTEKGKAALDTCALLKMAELQKCMEQEEIQRKESCNEETLRYCGKLEADCLFRLAKLKRKLVSMQKAFDKCCRMRSLLEHLNPGSDKHTQTWLKIQTIKMDRTTSKCNETEQAAQQILIMMCAAELTALRNYMRQNKIHPVRTDIS
jgi:DNA-binding XRE family transcriptional regulator